MPYIPKTGVQSFDSDWQKTQSWAQSQGISINSILPVYQLDLNRLQTGEYPMGQAERNLAVQAAHNPNSVTSAPSDQPASPWSLTGMFHNAVSDAGKIATGIEGIFTGSFERQVYDSAKATYKGIIDPASLNAPTFGGTISNWLDKTLLAYVPGATDVGTAITQGPEALLEHPLVSLLDVAGAYEGISGILGKLGSPELAAQMAEASGGKGLVGVVAKKIGNIPTNQGGATIRGQLVQRFSVQDRLENMMSRLPGGGVGTAIGDLQEARANSEMMDTDKYLWMMEDPTRELDNLPKEDQVKVQQILDTKRTTGGDSVRQAMEDPNLSPKIKAVLSGFINGPERFAEEVSLMAGEIRPTYNLNGDRGMWAADSDKAKSIFAKSRVAQQARREAIKTLDGMEPHVSRMQALDALRQKHVAELDPKVQTARREAFADPKLQLPLTKELPEDLANKLIKPRKRALDRKEQLATVINEGGLWDDFKKIVAKGDADQVRAVAETMVSRLSAWGPDSVNAADHPALMDLRATAESFVRWAKAMQKEQKEIDKAVYGSEKAARHHAGEQASHEAMKSKMLKDRQLRERDQQLAQYQIAKRVRAAKLAQTVTKVNQHKVFATDLYEREAEAEASRATNHVLDTVIMPKLRRRIYELNQNSAAEIRTATRVKRHADGDAWTEYQRDQAKTTIRHDKERRARAKEAKVTKQGMGDALAAVVRMGDAIRDFHNTVADTPADQYKDVLKALYHKKIIENEATSALVMAADKYYQSLPKMTEKRMAEIRSSPQVIAELIDMDFNEIMKQPDLDPELAAAAKAEAEEYQRDANETFKQMYYTKHDNPADDFRIQYIPSSMTLDESLGRHAIAPRMLRGVRKPDMVKAKVGDLTPQTHDFAVGINKAVLQALHRHSSITLMEDYLKPMALTRQQVLEHLLVYFKPEERAGLENTPQKLANLARDELGLTAFDPYSLFGASLPRWSKAQQLFLPTPIVDSLKFMEKDRQKNILARSNKVFRYSILGLSRVIRPTSSLAAG